MDLSGLGKWLLLIGAGTAVLGATLWLAGRSGFPLGRLPGDIRLRGEDWSMYLPITTCILASVLLTVLVNVFLRIFR